MGSNAWSDGAVIDHSGFDPVPVVAATAFTADDRNATAGAIRIAATIWRRRESLDARADSWPRTVGEVCWTVALLGGDG